MPMRVTLLILNREASFLHWSTVTSETPVGQNTENKMNIECLARNVAFAIIPPSSSGNMAEEEMERT